VRAHLILLVTLGACGAPDPGPDSPTGPVTALVQCRGMDGSSLDEMGETRVDVCREAVGPLARNETQAWLALVAPHVVVDPSLVPEADSPVGIVELRAALARAGGPRRLFGLDASRPVVVELEHDCRRCRRPAIALRVLGDPGVVLVIEGWSTRRITQIRRASPDR